MVRREKVGEVALLIRRINERSLADKGVKKTDETWTDSKGRLHIRREATDDSWY